MIIDYMNDYTVALLIDAENIQLKFIEDVLKFSAYFGYLYSEAFADWNNPSIASQKEKLVALNIDCIQVKNIGKNSVDNRLLVRIGEFLTDDPNNLMSPDVFVIVSGDGDFASACERIRERNKKLIIIGGTNTSYALKNVGDEFYHLQELSKELEKLEKEYPIHPNILRQVLKHLQMIFASNFGNDNLDGLNYDVVEKELHESLSNSSLNLGNYQLSECLKYLDKNFEKSGEKILINPYYLRMSALSMAYACGKKHDEDLVPLALFGECLRKSANKLSPNLYKNYFRRKKLTEWLAMFPETFKIEGDYVSLIPN